MAWTASVSVMVLAIGLAGGWWPRSAAPLAASPMEEPVPVVVDAPPPPQPPVPPPEASAVTETSPADKVAAPAEELFVAAVETPAAAFAVPVVGAAMVAPVKLASPAPVRPMTVMRPPSTNTLASPPAPPPVEPFAGQGQPDFPLPDYPRQARRRGWQGEVRLLITVGANGLPTEVMVEHSSGHAALDQHAVEHVKRRWVWPVGRERRFLAPIIFQLQ